MPLNFTSTNWYNVEHSTKTVVVDFFAPWCGPCRKLAPIVDELARECGDRVVIGKVNVDENQDIAAKYGVMSIPTVLIFKNGVPVECIVGVVAKKELMATIDAV